MEPEGALPLEAALRDSEQRFRVTIDSMPDAVILYDREQRVLYANPPAAANLGVPAAELVGKHAHDLFPKAVVAQVGELSARTISTRQRQTKEIIVAIPGRPKMVRELTMVAVVGHDDEVHQVLAISRDVTEQRTLVEELRESDRRKTEFIAVLSHELRNPLSAIRTSLEILGLVPSENPTVRKATGILDRQVTLLTRLVDDLLDVSRITQSKIELQRTQLDLADLVGVVVDDHQALFAQRGVRLDLVAPEDPLPVHGDGDRLTQVLGNLLHNAAKFTPSGGTTTVALSRDAAAGRAVVRVADTGAGIDPATLAIVFQPFSQADRTLARSMGGLGLGLALVKGLVELHGGEVRAFSEGEGRGSQFVVSLPLARG